MRKKGLASLYKEALKTSHEELERQSALEALKLFDGQDLSLGEFVAELKKDWKAFRSLSLAEVLDALQGVKSGRGAPKRRGAAEKAPRRAAKRAPKRVSKTAAAKYTQAIQAFLADNPGSRAKQIAAAVGLNNKQTAHQLKKLRADGTISVAGKAAGMTYSLKAAPEKKAAKPKTAPKKRVTKPKTAPKKRVTKPKTASEKRAAKKPAKSKPAPKKPAPKKPAPKKAAPIPAAPRKPTKPKKPSKPKTR